jgi:hypothetical protein
MSGKKSKMTEGELYIKEIDNTERERENVRKVK